jgi:peptide/nickel transport system substrate-binding protein
VKQRLLGAVVSICVLCLSACTSASSHAKSTGTSTRAGGTAYLLTSKTTTSLDPQRVYAARLIQLLRRIAVRTLVQYGARGGAAAATLYPDLATDTGRTPDGGRTWTFGLRTDATWQDGSPVTCADIKYGISRSFAADVITGGPAYARSWLDIPVGADGTSVYKGPYSKHGQAAFDQAIDCTPRSITFHLDQKIAYFNQAVTLPAFGAFKAAQDHGAQSQLEVFSDGPYELDGTYEQGKGGTFVRNPHWNPKSDPAGFRKALPDHWVIEEGLEENTVYDRLLADRGRDRFAVTDRDVPAAMLPEVAGVAGLEYRTSTYSGGQVEFLVPNFRSAVGAELPVRKAMAEALDKDGWVVASGGRTLRTPVDSLIPPGIPGHHAFNAFGVGPSGDPAMARKTLAAAGISMPVRLRVAYNSVPTADAQAAALKAGWERDGVFAVTLQGVPGTFNAVIEDPANAGTYDVAVAIWGPDWPTGASVLPPLLDSRSNIGPTSSNRDWGWYADPRFNALVDAMNAAAAPSVQAKRLQQMDEYAQRQGAYIPVALTNTLKLHGSGVRNYSQPDIFPDFGAIGVR